MNVTLTGMRALGVDYGRRRIGLALSDATGLLARPWKTIARVGTAADVATTLAAEVAGLDAAGEPVATVVLGFPRRLSGEPNEQTAAVQELHLALSRVVTIPIVLQDERLSSHEAERIISERVKDWRKRKPLLDAAAAAVILQDYLDSSDRHTRSAWEDDAK